MKELTLSNGKTMPVDVCLKSNQKLLIRLTDNMSVLEAATLFGFPSATGKISCRYERNVLHTYEGYTVLDAVMRNAGNGKLTIHLRKEEQA